MTPRNRKPAKDEVGRLYKGEMYVSIKKPSVIWRSAKANIGSVFAERKAFAKKTKKRKAIDSGVVEVLRRQLRLVSHILN